MRRYRSLLIALLVVIPVGVIFGAGAWLYLRQGAPPPPASPPPKPVPPPPDVLAAARDLSVGTLITANDIVWVPFERGAILPAYMLRDNTEQSTVIGSVVRRALSADTPLTWSAIVRPGQDGFLAAALTPRHRAVTISVDRATSHAGLIYPGDHVDVIFTMQVPGGQNSQLNTFTRTILENIRVVAVNRQVESFASDPPSEDSGSRRGESTVTLEVLPSEADRLVLATTKGSLSLALRPITKAGQRGWSPPTDLMTLLQLPATKETSPSPVQVQIFRGEQRQEVLLNK